MEKYIATKNNKLCLHTRKWEPHVVGIDGNIDQIIEEYNYLNE